MRHLLSAIILPLILGGCTSTHPSEITSLRSPSDPSAEIVSTYHRNPLAGYVDRAPVDPKPWRKLNDDAGSQEGDAS